MFRFSFISGFYQHKVYGHCKPEERKKTQLCHIKVKIILLLLCLFRTELGIAYSVLMWNFVYIVERKGKRFNIFLPSTLNLAWITFPTHQPPTAGLCFTKRLVYCRKKYSICKQRIQHNWVLCFINSSCFSVIALCNLLLVAGFISWRLKFSAVHRKEVGSKSLHLTYLWFELEGLYLETRRAEFSYLFRLWPIFW